MNVKTITLSTDIVNVLLQYLGSRPFSEVAHLINGIQSEVSLQIKAAQQAEVIE